MKQTNNAIKFLMAQYRAIFKHAYLKGIVSAVVLTTGLAAGASANAAALEYADISGTTPIEIDTASTDPLTVVFKEDQQDWNAAVTISDGNGDAVTNTIKNTDATGAAEVSGNGSLIINAAASDGLTISADVAQSLSINLSGEAGIQVKAGILQLTGSGTAGGDVSLAAKTITLGQATGDAAVVNLNDAGTEEGVVTLGNATSNISLLETASVNFKGKDASTAIIQGILDGQGGTLDFTSGNGTISAVTSYADGDETITEGGTHFDLPVAATKTATVALTPKVDENDKVYRGVLTFGEGSVIDLQQASGSGSGILSITSGTGIDGSTTAGSIVKIDAGVILTSKADSAGDGTSLGLIKVAGTSNSDSELHIDVGVLDSFLKVDKHENVNGGADDKAGAIQLGANSVLQLTNGSNPLTVELGGVTATKFDAEKNTLDLVLASGAATTTAGVFVSGTSVLKADKVQVTDAIANDLSNLTVAADAVTLGATDFKSSDTSSANANGLNGLTIKANADQTVTLVAGTGDNGAYNLVSGSIIRTGSYYKQDADGFNDHSQINPAAELINGNANLVLGNAGKLEVTGGNWQTAKDITIASGGTFTVTSTSGSGTFSGISTTKDNGEYSLVTLNGKLNLNSGSLLVTGTTGANAVLDLTSADVLLNSTTKSTITLSGSSSNVANKDDIDAVLDEKAGYGVLKVDGQKFLSNLFADGTTANMVVSGNGVLYVSNHDTGTYDFSKFGTTATAGTVQFSGAGYVVVDGNLHLTTGAGVDAKDGAKSGINLNIGSGTIVVDNLTLDNNHQTTTDKVQAYDAVNIQSGTFIINESLISTKNKDLYIGVSNSTTNLTFAGESGSAGTVGLNISTSGTAASNITFADGSWSAKDINLSNGTGNDTLTVGSDDLEILTEVSGNNLAAAATDVITIKENGKATFATAQIASANATINGALTLTGSTTLVSGDAGFEKGLAGVDLKGASFTVGSDGVLTIGDAVLAATDKQKSGSISFKTTGTGDSAVTTATINSALGATYNISQGGELALDFSQATADKIFGTDGVDATEAKALKDSLFAGGNLGGILNLGESELNIVWGADLDSWHTVTWDNIKEFAQITGGDVTTEKLKNTIVTEVKQGTNLSGQYAAIMVDSSHNTGVQVNANNDFGLHNAYEVDGKKYYIFKKESDGSISVLGLNSTAGDVTLAGGGLIGNTSVADTLSVIGDGTTIVQGKLDTARLNLSGKLEVTGDTTVSDYADIYTGASLTTANLIGNSSGIVVMGNAAVTNKLTLKDSALDVIGGTLSTKDAELSSDSELNVGYEKLSTVTKDDPETIFDETLSYGGNLEITGQLILNGGVLRLDPSYDRPAAFGAVNNLSDYVAVSTNTPDLKAGNLDGNVYIGQNSVLGIGVSSLEEVKTATSGFMNGEALNKDDVGAVLYLNKQFNIDDGFGLTLTADSVEGFAKYYADNKKNSTLALNSDTLTIDDTVYLGANTAILVSADVAGQADIVKNGTNAVAIIGFDKSNDNKGNVIADGGEFVLAGNVRVSTYKVFDNAEIKYIDGTSYDVVTDEKAAHYDDNINVSTENGVLVGVVGKDGTTSLTIADDARAKLNGASDPVYTSLVAYARGYNGDAKSITEAKDEDKLYTLDKDNQKVYTYNNDVLQYSLTTGNGAAAEQVARLGVYGGSVQAALTAGATTYDAVSARMGVGAQTGSITFADNGQGAGLWVTPVYKNHDSDGFEAQGLSYGADMDMYGVALGGDYTLGNGLRVGAAFNVGSGDADGQGAGAGVSNDFDYYGFTVYGGYTMDKFSVVADVSYTVVDNDVEGNNGYGKVSTSMDTTNLSFGVTGQYTFNLNAVDVIPHAGLRYTYIDMDDYNVKDVDGDEVARYAGDSMSVFSIPVGVTFSKEIVSGEWTVKPSFDLTLTANVGDDSIDGSVAWNGVDNLTTNLESEVIDSFTYGATLGVSAKTGNFSMGFGVNYTGASSADEYGVSANARFVF